MDIQSNYGIIPKSPVASPRSADFIPKSSSEPNNVEFPPKPPSKIKVDPRSLYSEMPKNLPIPAPIFKKAEVPSIPSPMQTYLIPTTKKEDNQNVSSSPGNRILFPEETTPPIMTRSRIANQPQEHSPRTRIGQESAESDVTQSPRSGIRSVTSPNPTRYKSPIYSAIPRNDFHESTSDQPGDPKKPLTHGVIPKNVQVCFCSNRLKNPQFSEEPESFTPPKARIRSLSSDNLPIAAEIPKVIYITPRPNSWVGPIELSRLRFE